MNENNNQPNVPMQPMPQSGQMVMPSQPMTNQPGTMPTPNVIPQQNNLTNNQVINPQVQAQPTNQNVNPQVQPTNQVVNQQQATYTNNSIPQQAQQVAPLTNDVQQSITEVQASNNPMNTNENVQPSIVEPNKTELEEGGDAEDVTFDYNALYGIQSKDINPTPVEEEKKPVFSTEDVVIQDKSLNNRQVDDVLPEFNLNALDSNVKTQNTKLTDNILDDKQKDKADTRKKILFIGAITIIIIVFLEFVIPIMAGYSR